MNNKSVIYGVLLISVVGLGLSIFTYTKIFGLSDNSPKAVSKEIFSKLDGYQAIFLVNGNTYFGKVTEYNSDYLVLDNVYYLKDSSETDFSLVKLGSESFGPKDPMIIKQGMILFLENLKADSKLFSKIKALESTLSK